MNVFILIFSLTFQRLYINWIDHIVLEKWLISEYKFPKESQIEEWGTFVLGMLGAILIFLVTIYVLVKINRDSTTAVINKLVSLDLVINLYKILQILFVIGIINIKFCDFRVAFSIFMNLSDRMISVIIVVYRWVFANHSRWVLTPRKRKLFIFFLLVLNFSVTLSLSSLAFMNLEKYEYYHRCLGQKYPISESQSPWDLPIENPFMVLLFCAFFSHTFLAPLLYFLIFKNLGEQKMKNIGLSAKSIEVRKRKNVVSANFNFIIWLSEALSLIILLLPRNEFSLISYFVFSSCSSPMLYYMGMAKNRLVSKNK